MGALILSSSLKGLHEGGEWVRGNNAEPPRPLPRQIFEKLVNKNAIKPKIVRFCPKSIDLPKDFGQKF